MTAPRPDHRVILDNLHLSWPAETVAAAQEQYDAHLRSLRPDDPGADANRDRMAGPSIPSAFDRSAMRAPIQPADDAGDGAAVVAMIALAGALMIGVAIGALVTKAVCG